MERNGTGGWGGVQRERGGRTRSGLGDGDVEKFACNKLLNQRFLFDICLFINVSLRTLVVVRIRLETSY